jgi:hypothetical protein
MFAFCLGTNRVHHSLIKQRLYQRRGHGHGADGASGTSLVDILKGFGFPAEFGDELTHQANPHSAVRVILALFWPP